MTEEPFLEAVGMGVVYLVGAGPGDPGLLTRRAAGLLRRADVVVYDALANPRLLELAPPGADRIHVGKRGGGPRTPQDEIHRILVDAARRTRVVVRLKGGDPFIFGRGAEEALALRAAGVRFEVVPGVTAAAGIAAYAGIPLTHRGAAAAVTLLTGCEESGPAQSRIDWERLAATRGTLVLYMGMRRLRETADRLIAAGRPPDTPAAVVQWGTYAFQRTVTAPLRAIADCVEEAGLGAPGLIIVGDVVDLHERLGWFERRPLFGLRVLVPRSRAQPSRLVRALAELGADVTEFPRLRVSPPEAPEPLRHALRSIGSCRWVVFTSAPAVSRFWREWRAGGRDARGLAGVRFACVGTATADALRRRGIQADVALGTFEPHVVASALLSRADVAGERVLFPAAAGARSGIAARLAGAGFRVHRVDAFRTTAEMEGAADFRRRLDEGGIDLVVFSSSGTVRAFIDALGAEAGKAAVAAMGPETVRMALSHGLRVHIAPVRRSIEGMVEGVRAFAADAKARRDGPGPDAAIGRLRLGSRS